VLRGGTETPYETDNHNYILDCRFAAIVDPRALDDALKNIHGVVDTGLFVGLTSAVFVGGAAGLTELKRA
jgi:ribose 5-phosphate isomerase A